MNPVKGEEVLSRQVTGFERLERRQFFSAVPVADLNISDIPDRIGADKPGAVVGDAYYFPVQWERGRPYFPPGLPSQLFRSDGTPDGTRPLKTFSSSDVLSDFTSVNGSLYFAVNARTSFSQIWRSDGTSDGTVMVHEGTMTSASGMEGVSFVAAGGDVYFNADGLWKVAAGATTATRVSTAVPQDLTSVGGRVYFLTTSGLWKTDGTAANTTQVKAVDIGYPRQRSLVDVGGTLFFPANSGRLYRSDGTADGTGPVMPTPAGSAAPPPYGVSDFTVFGDRLYFTAWNETGGTELWSSDGTAAGTGVVTDIRPGAGSSSPDRLVVGGDTLYFTADDGVHGRELWKTDGTAVGTTLVADLTPGTAGTPLRMPTAALGRLYFTYANPTVGRELFVTDGTADGTRLVTDLNPGPAGTLVQQMAAGGSRVYFTGVDRAHGYSAFYADQSAAHFGGDVLPGLVNSRHIGAGVAATDEGTLFFAAGDTMPTGREPHVIPPGGTARLAADLEPGPGWSEPQNFIAVGEQVLLRAATTSGTEVWRAGDFGVELLKDVIPAETDLPSIFMQGPYDGNVLINYRWSPDPPPTDPRQPSTLYEFWTTRGTEATTEKLANINKGPFVEMGDWLYYLTDHGGTTGSLVRMSRDGRTSELVKTVPSNPPSTRRGVPARDLRAAGGALYFNVLDAVNGSELWRSDGTAGGTSMVKDLAPGSVSSAPSGFTQLRGNTAVFAASRNYFEGGWNDLWVTDGTAAGTIRLMTNLPNMRGADPRDFVHFNGLVYFTADDGVSGRELWRTDGTAAGTVVVKDILPGAQGSNPADLKVISGRLYFFAADTEGGRELWSCDGTANGTVRVADVNPGPAGSEPMNLTEVYGDVYFTANDGTGPKLYRVAAPASRVAGRRLFYNHSALDGRDPAANAADDNAVATDKAALLPGQTASFANVSGYSRGINGVMIDLADRPSRPLRPEDFEVRVGNAADGSAWRAGPAPQSVSVRRLGNVDRVTLVWPDNALRNTWVEVKVRDTWNTGLAAPDVFYFGSAVGKPAAAAGATSFAVNAADVLAVRRQLLLGRASRDGAFDFNRDGAVTAADLLVARQAWATGFALAVLSAAVAPG